MKGRYYFKGGRFAVENYNELPPFTNFLPAVAGLKGRPVWAFYINRGQGIAGFGVGGKQLPIMEFFPAETAYATAPRQGFRTFLKIDGKYFEPFAVGGKYPHTMEIYRSGFKIEEKTPLYSISAEYFDVPNREFAALGRIVTLTNLTECAQKIEILDGLAQILPYGLSNSSFKETGNLFKSWMVAEGVDCGFEFVKMRSSTADTAEVNAVEGGNFFLPVGDFKVLADPKAVFGEDRTKTFATGFSKNKLNEKTFKEQCLENELFSAFAYKKQELPAGGKLVVCELIGYAESLEQVKDLKLSLTCEQIFEMQKQADSETENIANKVETHTAFDLFDEYLKQSYFDNVLRGGMPVTVGGKPYYVFSRKHGDPERDYNAFQIEPNPYSCGNGNFRDVVQNRRNDLYITPECGDFNIKYFFSLLQADGYNPLSVLGVKYTCKNPPSGLEKHSAFLSGEFTVGEAAVKLKLDGEKLNELIGVSKCVYKAKFSEGYWTDHFVYLIDLITAYMGVYPDKMQKLLYETPLKWFRSGVRIVPKNRRAVLQGGKVRRLYSIEKCGEEGWQKAGNGEYETSLAAKLLFLALIKTATLDPIGCGIDMEGGKPGWCDATNGLPALFGSNVADGLELLRLIKVLKMIFKEYKADVQWCGEQNEFFRSVTALLEENSTAAKYYEKSADYKEKYLNQAYSGFNLQNCTVKNDEILKFLTLAEQKSEKGIAAAKKLGGGRIPTYLAFEVESYEQSECGFVSPKKFNARALPHFAEGVAKSLCVDRKEEYTRAVRSPLYDKKLKLFRTSEPLDNETLEIGRIRSFPAGWLERESCFLHMSYKLLLSLLSAGMYDEFYSEIKTGLVPFMPPERYGRSVLENSSFIVTSNHGDKSKWGKGYQARLTGANAEVLSMWRHIMGFERPFLLENGELKFKLSPKLHKDFFRDGKVSFTLFGTTVVTYVNNSGKSTWEGVNAEYYGINGVKHREISGELAEELRSGKIKEIEVGLE